MAIDPVLYQLSQYIPLVWQQFLDRSNEVFSHATQWNFVNLQK